MRCRSLLALLALSVMPFGVVVAKQGQTPAVEAQDAPQTPPAADAPTVTYLGVPYAILPKCLATGFVVGLNQTPAEQTDMLLIAVPFPGGVTVIPPKPVAATGKLASAGLNDAVCLDVTDAP